ncbi:MAG TPA: hypothetical protein P5026_07895 [Kiritimatiellia bacterium]|nr:hypothetical protein [Kiritimatiellia bacterium]HRU10250.1 hypothetical protein [Thermoanaerobaculia bacterium]
MLTPAQRPRFFSLARAAYATVAPGIPFDAWRRQIMVEAGYPASTSEVDHVWGYEELMLRFAVLAYDADQIGYFTSCSERRLRWVLSGLATDLQYLQKSGVSPAYIEGIYRQGGLLPAEFADAPAQRLWLCLQILDTRIRTLAAREEIGLRHLPTAGKPWEFRGVHAARYAAFCALAASRARVDAGLPSDAAEPHSGASVRALAVTA